MHCPSCGKELSPKDVERIEGKEKIMILCKHCKTILTVINLKEERE